MQPTLANILGYHPVAGLWLPTIQRFSEFSPIQVPFGRYTGVFRHTLYIYIHIHHNQSYHSYSSAHLPQSLCYEPTQRTFTGASGLHLLPGPRSGMQFCYDEMLTNPHQQQLLHPAMRHGRCGNWESTSNPLI